MVSRLAYGLTGPGSNPTSDMEFFSSQSYGIGPDQAVISNDFSMNFALASSADPRY